MVGSGPRILYEDENFLAVGKPAGLLAHSDGRSDEKTLADWLRSRYPSLEGVGEPLKLANGEVVRRCGIVHRIDRDTSGVLLVAKNESAFSSLKRLFQDRKVEKVYRVFVYGEIEKDDGLIEKPIGRDRGDFRRWSAGRQTLRGRTRDAVTSYRVLGRLPGFSFLEVRPETGRTHQIRVHLKAIGHPVVCDKLYAPERACALGFSRLALHARSITFPAASGNKITVTAPYPDDFAAAVGALAAAGAVAED